MQVRKRETSLNSRKLSESIVIPTSRGIGGSRNAGLILARLFTGIATCLTSLTGSDGSAQNGAVVFATTHGSVVLTAQGESPAAQEALEKLCRIYWWPLYGFVRRQSKLWQFQAVSVLGSIARRSALRKNRRLPRAQVTLRSALPALSESLALSEAERVEWAARRNILFTIFGSYLSQPIIRRSCRSKKPALPRYLWPKLGQYISERHRNDFSKRLLKQRQNNRRKSHHERFKH